MEIVRCEFRKLKSQKFFIALFLILAVVNSLTFYISEKDSSVFFYVYQQRENYDRFRQGDTGADVSGYYQSDVAQQEAYIASYQEFLGEMASRAEQMGSVSIFADRDSYVYKNLEKTRDDFAHLNGIVLEADNCYGIRQYAKYNQSILFLLVFLVVLAYYVLFWERDLNLFLLLKGTYRGHVPLALAKWFTMLAVTIVYTLLQEIGLVFLAAWLYGFGNLARTVQSVSLFRNCAYSLSVGEAVAAIIFIRLCIAVVLSSVVYAAGVFFKSKITAGTLLFFLFGTEYLFSAGLSISGGLGILKAVNPFYLWSMEQVLGNYYNLNLAGIPVGKNITAVTVAVMLWIVLTMMGVLAFSKMFQIPMESRLERVMQWLREKLSFLGRRTSLFFFEGYKLLVQQKKWLLLLILLLWGGSEVADVYGERYYATEKETAYHYYLNQMSGKITAKTYEFIAGEQEVLDKKWQKLLELKQNPTNFSAYMQQQIWLEIGLKEEGFEMVKQQLSALEQKEGAVEDKYFVDELAYITLWYDTGKDISQWFIGSVGLLLFVCGIYTGDEKRKMQWLLKSTFHGRKKLNRTKNLCAAVCVTAVFLISEMGLFLEYYEIDHFSCVFQKMADFTSISIPFQSTLGMLLGLVFFLKLLAFALIGLAGAGLARLTKNETLSVCTGIGLAGIVCILAYRFGWSINMLFLR